MVTGSYYVLLLLYQLPGNRWVRRLGKAKGNAVKTFAEQYPRPLHKCPGFPNECPELRAQEDLLLIGVFINQEWIGRDYYCRCCADKLKAAMQSSGKGVEVTEQVMAEMEKAIAAHRQRMAD